MQIIIFLLMATLAMTSDQFNGCKDHVNIKKDSIRGVNLLYHLPIIQPDGSKDNLDNTYDVYYSGSLNMYKFNYVRDSGDQVSELNETRYFYLTHHKDSVYGYLFDPFKTYPEGRIKIDSLQLLRFENPQWDTIATMKADSNYINEQGDLVNVYNLPPTPQYPGRFTYYFYYTNRLRDIRESFSKKLEGIHGKKLYRIRMVIHPIYYEPYKMMLPVMESFYEMKTITVHNREEIEGYFDKYKKLTARK